MQEVLERLSREPWVRGSMIVSYEGMVVMDNVSPELDREAVAALASDLVTEASAGLEEAGMEPFTRIVLTATAGELVVVGCGNIYLVVIAAAGSEAFYIEIDSAARQLRRLAPTASLRDL
jgi:predicted regulator of Ras-like GTPase activity (Roadblock/LC7/MglB family)